MPQAGRPKVFVRRHVLEIKEDTREWIEETIASFTEKRAYGRNSRVLGAAITAAGVYTMVRLVVAFGRGLIEKVKELTTDIFTDVSIPVINVFTSIFGVQVGIAEQPGIPEQRPGDILKGKPAIVTPEKARADAIGALEGLGQFDPFAFGAALMAGGMVLAGLNPGEILRGIGSIIDGLIPL